MVQDVHALYEEARQAIRAGNFPRARKLLAELWRHPTWRSDPELIAMYAYATERTGDYTEALSAYRAMIERLRRQGVALEALETIDAAVGRLKAVASESEAHPEEHTVDPLRDEDTALFVEEMFADAYERRLARGEFLCRHGDVARQMWLLTHGEVDVIVPNQPVESVVGRPDRPCLLGEIGYFTGLRRVATLAASSAVRVLELPYERIAAREREEPAFAARLDRLYRVRLLVPLLSRHEVFKRMNEVDRRKLAAMFERMDARPGQMLFAEGEDHPYAYFVQRGTLLVLGRDARGRETLLGGVHPGDIVHLGGLLEGFSPKYHMMASTPCRLLRLARARFAPFVARRPWLVKAILKFSRHAGTERVMHPDAHNLWAADRYVELKRKGR